MNNTNANSSYDDILSELTDLAISRFSWENLPQGLTSENFESMLIRYGELFGHKTSTGNLLILPFSRKNSCNVYGEYTQLDVFSLNGIYHKNLEKESGIIFKNNPTSTGNLNRIQYFAERLDNVDKTQDVNLFQQNIPKVLLTDENSKLTVKNILKQITEFKFVIFGRKSLAQNISTSDVLDTSSPYILDKLQEFKTEIRNEALTYLGINNNNNIKKERMVVDEINANNEYIKATLDLMFDLRKKASEEFNSLFGTNIIVSKREVEDNGGLHFNNKAINGE